MKQRLAHWGLAALLCATSLVCGADERPAPQPAVPAVSALPLSPEQQAVLAAHPVLRLGVQSDFAPIEFIDAQGQHAGVISGYMRVLEKQLGIRFEVVQKNSWAEVLAAFDRGEIDVLSALKKNAAREQTMRFTAPYIAFADGIFVRSDEGYVEQLKDFPGGRRLAVVQGYNSNLHAAAANPQLVAVPVRSTEEALFAVSTGRADIAVSSLAVAYQLTQSKGLNNLRVAASFSGIDNGMGMAVQPGLAALLPIFDQALAAIPQSAHSLLRTQWTGLPMDQGIARSTVVFWAAIGVLVLLMMAAWLVLLLSQQRRCKQLLARAEQAEAQSRAMIEAMPANFWMLRQLASGQIQMTLYGSLHLGSAWLRDADSEQQQSFDEATRFMPAADRARFQALLEEHGRTLTSFRFEHRTLAGTAEQPGWVHVQAVPRRDKSGVLWHGCSIDITERKALEAALLQSRNQLQELAAGVPGALWQFRREPDGLEHYSYMSEGIVGITGRTAAETNQMLLDKSYVSVHPDDLPILQALMARLGEHPGMDEARYRLRTTSGSYKWVQVAARAMPVEADGALVWNGITMDATRIHDTETALRLERQRIQDLADSLSGALWRLRKNAAGAYYFDYISEGVVHITGRQASQLVQGDYSPLDPIVEADRDRVAEALQTSGDAGTPLEVEYSIYSASGGIERLFARAAVRYQDGLPVWTGVLLNVTDRHRLQQQLADARSRIEDIAANFPGAIFQILRQSDNRSEFTYISDGITSLTGRPPRTKEDRTLFSDYNNIHPEDRAQVHAASQAVIASCGSTQFDYRLLDVHGCPRWVHCAMTARRQDDASTVINGLLLDAEESKRLEGELRAASEQAEAASRVKSRFLANMSHEIRTPMNAVIGLAHIALNSETNPAQAERIGKIHKAGKALLKLLNDILEYSRLEAGKFVPVLAPFDVQELNEGLRLFCALGAETKGLALVIDCDASTTSQWLGDATRIQQVLLNLLTNAIKFTDHGQVTLTVQPLADARSGLRFVVRDTGIGMSAAEVQRVFEAFEQARGETEHRHGGSGLGLSISRELVHALGGTLRVESMPGQGSTFTVDLPLQAAAVVSSQPLGDMRPRLLRLASQLEERDTAGARLSLAELRAVLAPQGRDSDLYALERQLASFDIEAAQIELARLRARWGLASG